MDEFSLH
jgi:hypothetical protein